MYFHNMILKDECQQFKGVFNSITEKQGKNNDRLNLSTVCCAFSQWPRLYFCYMEVTSRGFVYEI